jgi:hypothetical protein
VSAALTAELQARSGECSNEFRWRAASTVAPVTGTVGFGNIRRRSVKRG